VTRENARTDRPVPLCGLHLLPADIRVGDEMEAEAGGARVWARVVRIGRTGWRPRRYVFGFEPIVFEKRYGSPTERPKPITMSPDSRHWVWPAEVERPPPPKVYESGSW
jgi:hypothetical protein